MRVLAIDHGLARTGLATCDPTGTIVRPLDVVEPTAVEPIAELVGELGIGEVVVGLPLSLDGYEGSQARLVREFADRLAEAVEVPVRSWDERLTTALAGSSRRAGARAAEDSLAAAHLLESYLASRERA
ncbi:MAG: Holliday junction resolvase RuvX [Solirubrobacterales bacterium]